MKKTISTVALSLFIAATTLIGFSSLTLAEDRYVGDIVYIPLRADKDNQAGVLKNGLASGTKLKFVREEEDAYKNKWSQVVTADGIEGWVRSQNLINEPTAALKLEAFTSGSSNVLELQKQNIALKGELENLKTTYQTLLKDTDEIRAAATSDINMEQENQKMHRENQLLQTERDVLRAENYQLKNTDRYNQRLYGGALVVCGVVLSLILQLFGKRKRHSDWN